MNLLIGPNLLRIHFSLRTILGAMLSAILATSAAAQAVSVSVNAAQTVRTVDERVFGLNAVIWDPQTSDSQTVSLVQAAGVRMVRIPGGSLSDTYNWSLNKSYDTTTTTSGYNTWTWSSNMSNFATLITGAGTQAFVTVNYGSGTPQEAAAWVAYANSTSASDVSIGSDGATDWSSAASWATLRGASPLGADDGRNFLRVAHAAPYGLKYWEIGNECYGSWEYDRHTIQWDPVTYANAVKDYMAAMKAVDPSIKIGVVAETGEDNLDSKSPVHNVTNPRTNASHHGWTPVMLATLKSLGVVPDFLIYHRYEQGPGAESDAGLLQTAKTWPIDAANLRQMLTDYLGTGSAGVEICVTENNSVYSNPGKQTTSLVDGLYMADSIGNVLQTEINSLVWWDLRNGQDNAENNSLSLYGWRQYGDYGVLSTPSAFGSTTYYDAYPTYYVMKLLSNFARNGDTIVSATSSNTLLSVFAARHSDGSVRLLVINKSPTSDLTANVAIAGVTPGSTATLYTYGKVQDTAAQTGTGSHDVASSTFSVSGTSFQQTFPSYSASVVVLPTSAAGTTDALTINSTTFPATASPGQHVTFDTTVTNTGTNTWGANHYLTLRDTLLITSDPANSNLAFASLSGVGTGANITVSLSFTAPAVPGPHAYVIEGLDNNVAWLTGSQAETLHVGESGIDLNNDGKPDLIWSNTTTGDRAIWFMNGASLDSFGYLAGISTDWRIVGVGDFNGDGQADLVWENTTTGDRTFWLMNGTTISSFGYLAQVDTAWHIAAVGDFNGDGQNDIIWENTTTGDRAVWFLDGMNIVSFGYIAGIDPAWQIVGAGDLDGDGKPDLVWENRTTGDRTVWFMNGATLSTLGYIANIPGAWHIADVVDIDGDGHPDLVWENTSTGDRAIWLMNGVNQLSAPYLAFIDPVWSIAP
ncbi:MAG TPA: FG-GAP-like repeat-containing protein [Candidatus Didemnitutus sp.]|nr:FG-GAP-like repeat-containing protein [Candidatus Didemnitutus sp.]